MGIIAENMQRHGIVGPVWSYGEAPPTPADYYCHHPWGIFLTTRVFFEVVGRHELACRLPAIVLSALTPLSIFFLGRELFRPSAGAAAAWAFAVLPISLSFAAFNALEVPTIFYSTLTLLAWARHQRLPSRRRLALLCGAAALALNADWPAFVLVGCLVAVDLGRFALAGRERASLTSAVALAAIGLLVGGGYLALFAHYGKLGDLTESYALRSSVDRAGWMRVLDRRRFWIELMFTSLGIGIAKAGAVVGALRFALAPRARELVLPTTLAMAMVQYFVFRQGAEVHVFWPHYFALSFALAVAVLVATLSLLLEPYRVAGYLGRLRESWPVALGLVSVALAAIARDGVAVADWGRATGGRFSEKGAFIESRADAIFVLARLGRSLPAGQPVALHTSMDPSWAEVWAAGGRPVTVSAPLLPDLRHPVVVADLSRLSRDEARILFSRAHVELYERVAIVTAGEGVTGFRFERREPSARAWLLESAHQAALQVRPDPLLAAELLRANGFDVASPPFVPETTEELREAHNLALGAGDRDAATELEGRILARFEPRSEAFEDGTTLLGQSIERGVEPRVTLLFRAGGPVKEAVRPKVYARVVAPLRGSTIFADPTVRDVAPPPLLPRDRWLEGGLYTLSTPLLPRPWRERYFLEFEGPSAPRPRAELFEL